MTEIILSKNQLEDSLGSMQDAVSSVLTRSEKTLYQPDATKVPRPLFKDFQAAAALSSVQIPKSADGRYLIAPSTKAIVTPFAGLRGIATGKMVEKKTGQLKVVSGPAILLANGKQVAVLVAETEPDKVLELQQAMLESTYLEAQAEAAANHQTGDISNAGALAPSLAVATSAVAGKAHDSVHDLAVNDSFGTNYSNSGRKSINFGSKTYAPLTAILPLNNVLFKIGEADQYPDGGVLLGAEVSSGEELSVGIALAATVSKGIRPQLANNIEHMIAS